MALRLFVAEGEQVHRVVQRFGETIEAGRVGFELAEAVGAGEGNGANEVETAQVVDRLTEGRCMHVEAFAEGSEGHVRAFGQNVKHGELQAGNAVALL